MSAAAIGAVVVKDLSQRIRDRSALLNGVVAPLLLTVLMTLAFGRGEPSFHASVALVDADGGPIAAGFTELLAADGLRDVLTVERARSREAALADVLDGDADVAIVLPRGLGAAVDGGGTGRIEVLRSNRAPTAGAVAESLVRSYASGVDGVRRAVAAARIAGATASDDELAGRARALAADQGVEVRGTARAEVAAASSFAPAMSVFFLWFVVGLGVRSVVAERTNGTFTRLLAAPVPGRAILMAKAAATFLLGLTSMTVMAVASTVLLGASWGPPPASAAVIVAMTLAATAVGACVITVARTARQAGRHVGG